MASIEHRLAPEGDHQHVAVGRLRGVERLQMKWFTWAVAVTAVLWIGGGLLPSEQARTIVEPVALLSMCLAPVDCRTVVRALEGALKALEEDRPAMAKKRIRLAIRIVS